VLGTNLFESFPGIVYEDSPYVEAYRRSMDEGLPGEFEAYYPEPLNMWLRVHSYPATDGIIIFFRDFTIEKLALEGLQEKSEEAERQLSEIETVYRTAPIGLALFDVKDFRYLRLNDRQADFFGLKPEQVVGRTLTEMAPIAGLRELFEQVARGEPVVNYPLEGTVITHPDDYRYWTVSYFPVYAADGTIQAITAASLEITQQKKAEQALIQTEKLAAVGRLASSIAHEINNPLESVTNLLYLARHSKHLDEIQSYLELAERELRRVSAISNQTLRFHKQSTSPQDVTAESLIESVLLIYQGRIVNSQVKVEMRLRAHAPVKCFEGEIRQVLSNLVSNAIDAMSPRGGRLRLRCRTDLDWKTGRRGVVITVADTGAGMARETLKRLFEPFYTTKGISGTGLGLWVSRQIVDRHRGKIWVRSCQVPGRSGTVFTMFLPFTAATRD
jgi:PAS domain S-box-containing protein